MYFLKTALSNEYQIHFGNKGYWLQFIASCAIHLWVYQMTSVALTANLNTTYNWYGQSYFHFVVIGELGLMLQLAALEASVRSIRTAHFNGFLEHLLYLSPYSQLQFLALGISSILKDFVHWLTMIMLAWVIFDLSLLPQIVLPVLALILVSLPAYFVLGQIFSSVVIATGRGGGITSNFLFLISIVSGTYFPTEVFPKLFQDIFINYLPTTFLLKNIRLAWNQNLSVHEFASVVLYYTILFILFYFTNQSIQKYAKSYKTKNESWSVPIQ